MARSNQLPDRVGGLVYQTPTPPSDALAPYTPPAAHPVFRSAFRAELGRGAARGAIQLIPGLIVAGLAYWGIARIRRAYREWRDERQARRAKKANASERARDAKPAGASIVDTDIQDEELPKLGPDDRIVAKLSRPTQCRSVL